MNLRHWLYEPELRIFYPEIVALVDDSRWDEIEDAFATHLVVGTGGIRGRLGPGPNRINQRTICEAAQAVSYLIEDLGPDFKSTGVVIGYEVRRQSEEFAIASCEVFAARGIRSYLFDGIRATPEVSFAVRHISVVAGVQITASHNPRTDNGFKFYWSDGGQITPPHDARFMELVGNSGEIRRIPINQAIGLGLVSFIGHDVDRAYIKAVCGLSTINSRSAKIVFSPIHGAGTTNVLKVLREEKFDVNVVSEQADPDEDFPTAVDGIINPEYPEVMELPIAMASDIGADIAICSDPDADRIGVAAKVDLRSCNMRLLSGNQVGVVLAHYLLSHRKNNGSLIGDEVVLETLVTTSLIADIARRFGLIPRDDLLVGFKFIAEAIGELDDISKFIFAAEESLGYLAGSFVRDKDAAIGSLLVCELASWLKDRDETVVMYLDEIYREYGYYNNTLLLVDLLGNIGIEIMTVVMVCLRNNPPVTLGGLVVLDIDDRLEDKSSFPDGYYPGGSTDVVSLYLSSDRRTRVTIRPSGTEPKLKIYLQHFGPVEGDLDEVKNFVDSKIDEIRVAILDYCRSILNKELLNQWDTSHRRSI